jgi:general secretion pathway protein J
MNPKNQKSALGFTLIEVLLALVIVSVMTLLAWRGIDSMSRAGEQTQEHDKHLARVQTTLAQWSTDLDQMFETHMLPPLDFDGQVLRLTRHASVANQGVVVVAWTLRQGRLQRWSSPGLFDKTSLQASWDGALRWARTPLPEDEKRVVHLIAAQSWQIFYFRGDGWSNPQSSSERTQHAQAFDPAPDGVRLILNLPSTAGMAGKLTRDWIQPTMGATK